MNRDGVVNVIDIVIVGQHFGERITTPRDPNPDVNGDGIVDILDLVLVGQHFGESYLPGAPSMNLWAVDQQYLPILKMLYDTVVLSNESNVISTRELLQKLISSVRVSKTSVFQNYPNPFNPETWIPYQLNMDSDVVIEIYNASGNHIRTLNLGYQSAGFYTAKDKAAYWDGKNEVGEQVSSGLYFYTIQAGDYTATKKMVIAR